MAIQPAIDPRTGLPIPVATTGPAITGTCTLNAVPVGHITDAGAADLFVTESWLHYIDVTHANIIEQEGTPGVLGALSAINSAGFQWDQPQTIALSQDAQAGNHIVVYAIIVDYFLKGV